MNAAAPPGPVASAHDRLLTQLGARTGGRSWNDNVTFVVVHRRLAKGTAASGDG